MYRFPDVLTRLHAATKAASVGIALVLVGTGAVLGPGSLSVTAVVAVFAVDAVATLHALAAAALPAAGPTRGGSP